MSSKSPEACASTQVRTVPKILMIPFGFRRGRPSQMSQSPLFNFRLETSAFVSARPLEVSTAGADSKVGTPSPRSPICGEERKRSKVSQRSHHHYYHHYVVCTYQLSHVAVNSTEIGDGSSGGGRLLEEEERKVSVVTSRETKIARCDSAVSRIPWQQGGK
jgi:hypothetical protein